MIMKVELNKQPFNHSNFYKISYCPLLVKSFYVTRENSRYLFAIINKNTTVCWSQSITRKDEDAQNLMHQSAIFLFYRTSKLSK